MMSIRLRHFRGVILYKFSVLVKIGVLEESTTTRCISISPGASRGLTYSYPFPSESTTYPPEQDQKYFCGSLGLENTGRRVVGRLQEPIVCQRGFEEKRYSDIDESDRHVGPVPGLNESR